MLTFLLFLLAVLIAVYGVVRLIRGDIILGIILLIVAALVGPGGYSIWG